MKCIIPLLRMTCIAAGVMFLAGCEPNSPAPTAGHKTARIAAANSYLEAAVRELLGSDCPVLRLADPGMCPGHFDLRPSQIDALRDCRLLLLFGFQSALEDKLRPLMAEQLRVAAVELTGGLCEPESYLAACRQVARELVAGGWLEPDSAEQRLAAVAERMRSQAQWARQKLDAAGLSDCPVVTSRHQRGFCEFLGLEVVGTFGAADTASIAEIEQAAMGGGQARIVIANRPEGRRMADVLAGKLQAEVVVFDNFPDPDMHHGRFDELFRGNVQRLADALSR